MDPRQPSDVLRGSLDLLVMRTPFLNDDDERPGAAPTVGVVAVIGPARRPLGIQPTEALKGD